jgi:hypothetical protein
MAQNWCEYLDATKTRQRPLAMAKEQPADDPWEARWQAGDITAVARAIQECHRAKQPPPWWLVDAAKTLTVAAMAEKEKRLRRDWNIHQRRWEALTELRDRRDEFAERGDDRGATWERAREAVSDLLKGSAAEGSADAIKRSYDLVQVAGGADATFESYKKKLRRQPG